MSVLFRLRQDFVFAEFSGILVAPSLVANLAPRSHGVTFAGLGFLIAPLLSCKQFYIQVAGVFSLSRQVAGFLWTLSSCFWILSSLWIFMYSLILFMDSLSSSVCRLL